VQFSVAAQHGPDFAPVGVGRGIERAGRQRKQGHQTEQDGGGGIAGKQPEIAVNREKTGHGRPEGEAGVEGHAQRGKGRDPLGGRHQISQQGAAGGAKEFVGESGERGQHDDEGQVVRLRQQHHCRRAGEHGQRDGLAAAEFIGQVAAEQRGEQAAHAVGAHGNARLGEGVTLAGEIQGEEGDHKRAELVQERAEEKHPRRARQRPQAGEQGGWWVHGH